MCCMYKLNPALITESSCSAPHRHTGPLGSGVGLAYSLLQTYLDKEWNGVESPDDDSVVDVSGQDVQGSRSGICIQNKQEIVFICMQMRPSPRLRF